MFEEGAELKARLGPDQVYDFTLGNPDLEPPPRFQAELVKAAARPAPRPPRLHAQRRAVKHPPGPGREAEPSPRPGVQGPGRRRHLRGLRGLNVILKALLDPGDEVIILAPYFPEYLFYADNHGGVARVVETDEHFLPDLDRLTAALSPRTRAVIINSPNNPTGQIYERRHFAGAGAVFSPPCGAPRPAGLPGGR